MRGVLRSLFLFFCLVLAPVVEARRLPKYEPAIFELGCPEPPSGEMAFINGINHKPPRAVKCSALVSALGGGYNVFTVYNPTDGLLGDLRKCYFELFKFHASPPTEKLHEKWDRFFDIYTNNEKFLQFCHSQGAIQVRNALLRYPMQKRKRIIVVAIAPAAYIPQTICCAAFHYVSRRDIVPHFDRRGRRHCADSTIVLTPHRDAAFFDHHFLSPTYRPAIRHHLQEYLEHEGFWLHE